MDHVAHLAVSQEMRSRELQASGPSRDGQLKARLVSFRLNQNVTEFRSQDEVDVACSDGFFAANLRLAPTEHGLEKRIDQLRARVGFSEGPFAYSEQPVRLQ